MFPARVAPSLSHLSAMGFCDCLNPTLRIQRLRQKKPRSHQIGMPETGITARNDGGAIALRSALERGLGTGAIEIDLDDGDVGFGAVGQFNCTWKTARGPNNIMSSEDHAITDAV